MSLTLAKLSTKSQKQHFLWGFCSMHLLVPTKLGPRVDNWQLTMKRHVKKCTAACCTILRSHWLLESSWRSCGIDTTIAGRQDGKDSVAFMFMFIWYYENVASSSHFGSDQVHTFTATVFPNGNVLNKIIKIYRGPTLQLTGFEKKTAVNALVSDTTAHSQRWCGDHALMVRAVLAHKGELRY